MRHRAGRAAYREYAGADTAVRRRARGDDLHPVIAHVCTALPALGQSCDATAIYYCDPTKAGALCDSTTSHCVATSVASPNGACGTLSGASVACNGACNLPTPDAGAGTCSPYLAAGQPCGAGDLCLIGTTCTGGVCTAMACDGTPVPPSGSDAAADAEPADAGGQ